MKHLEQTTRSIFSQPTAPFREGWVLNAIEQELKKLRVPYFFDSVGNIIAGAKNLADLKAGPRRLGLIAHTDHPGFHLHSQVSSKPLVWKARWLGGGPGLHMKDAPIAIFNAAYPNKKITGIVLKSEGLGKDKRGLDWIWIKINQPKSKIKSQLKLNALPFPLTTQCFGAFDFPGYQKRGNRIITKAADDLAGCVTILETFRRLSKSERKYYFGIFTRAEEVGFRGALGSLFKNSAPQKHFYISLEASRTLPGARLGKGPVIRLGDRRTLFDSEIIFAIDQAATNLKGISFQRRIMDGGTCEATAFNLFGRRCAGLAVPLFNYHNQGNKKPQPEIIDVRDLENMIALSVETTRWLIKNKDPFASTIKSLKKGFKTDLKLLNQRILYRHG